MKGAPGQPGRVINYVDGCKRHYQKGGGGASERIPGRAQRGDRSSTSQGAFQRRHVRHERRLAQEQKGARADEEGILPFRGIPDRANGLQQPLRARHFGGGHEAVKAPRRRYHRHGGYRGLRARQRRPRAPRRLLPGQRGDARSAPRRLRFKVQIRPFQAGLPRRLPARACR